MTTQAADEMSTAVSAAVNDTNNPVNASTTHLPVTPVLPNGGWSNDQEPQKEYYFEAAELGIPFALTAAIIIGVA